MPVCLEKYLGEGKNLQLSVIMQCIPRYVLWIELCAPKRYLEVLPPVPQFGNRVIADIGS